MFKNNFPNIKRRKFLTIFASGAIGFAIPYVYSFNIAKALQVPHGWGKPAKEFTIKLIAEYSGIILGFSPIFVYILNGRDRNKSSNSKQGKYDDVFGFATYNPYPQKAYINLYIFIIDNNDRVIKRIPKSYSIEPYGTLKYKFSYSSYQPFNLYVRDQ